MKYKMVCIDLDGTLLNKNHQISNYNLSILKKLKEKGVVISLVTGRRYKSALEFAQKIELEAPLICFNGGMIINTKTEQIIHSSTLPKDYAKRVIKEWVKTGAPTFAYETTLKDPDVYNQNDSDHHQIRGYFKHEKQAIKKHQDLAGKLHFEPLCIKTFGYEAHIESCDSLREQFIDDRVLWLKTKDPNNTYYLEIYPIAAKKSFGLKWLSEHYNIAQEQIIAIGDNLNDLDMLEWAGCGVAMGNALPEVKEVANLITDTCDNDGVGKILEQLFLGL
ncbi:HAD family phosphatase [Clostridium sp. 'deep sea']|uniref:Cof-type HAD-IIB family hydrolase n=1 Tax=Clostridium sp. 'deep sea' TaxID=2779445 RepID=UPI0018968448|nr:Cof-type HAD-IIB family hydrolase [Clostridium sp. 'deep sea']QOR34472.1 HAD family phosphatase [Clostridium sp. 'deep sea']